MKDHLLQLIAAQKTSNQKVNIMREYLQANILRTLHSQGAFRTLAFVGGTALRFLYNLPRYSEDLDFSLEGSKSLDFRQLMMTVKREFELTGYKVELTHKDQKTVFGAFIKFEGLSYEAGISPHKSQKFSIKLDVDTNPPKGAELDSIVINKFFLIAYASYKIPSLFAGKLHALLNRPYVKGRDFFDLGWYLSTWRELVPNLVLLRNALAQTGWEETMPDEKNWRELIAKKVVATDWNKVKKDVENFLERPGDALIFNQENILGLLKPQNLTRL